MTTPGEWPGHRVRKMRYTVIILIIASLAWASITCSAQLVRDPAVLKRLEGTWEGSGRIVVNWTKAREMQFTLTFAADGTVTGMAGDSILRNGKLHYNDPISTWFGNPRFNVVADLEGPIIAAEDIRRKSIGILLDFDGEELECDGNTSGWHIGNRDTMWMKISWIRMKRVAAQ